MTGDACSSESERRRHLIKNDWVEAIIYEADSSLRDTESIALKEDIQTYFEQEVLPHVSGAWINQEKTSRLIKEIIA